jgi:hypothetical protein
MPVIDEYLRRQAMSTRDYAGLLAHLRSEFPDEPFLLVRYGDRQPDFAFLIQEPAFDEAAITQRLINYGAILRPTTPSTRSTISRSTCRHPGIGRPAARCLVCRTE